MTVGKQDLLARFYLIPVVVMEHEVGLLVRWTPPALVVHISEPGHLRDCLQLLLVELLTTKYLIL